MRVIFCGVRGSTPAPGAAFVRYGGNTSCVALAHDGEAPSLVLDGGTGLRRLTKYLDGETFKGTILIGHLHWDHTHGLPFFRAGDAPDARVRVLIPEQGDAAEVMARAISPPHFPVRLEELRGDWSVGGLDEGTFEIEGFTVTAAEIPHKASRTYGFRISDGSSTLAYMSDHWPCASGMGPEGLGEYHEAALMLAKDADLLVHDAQYTAEEYPVRGPFGHAAIEYAINLAEIAHAKALMLFHHDPDRTDDEIDAYRSLYSSNGVRIEPAAEGAVVDL
ncbi:MAG: MBL fold metallo-hydrolase [Actinomycetota bacterium]|nr:MBL fold metallo-hydrolase [Actinomycetota bacterium]